MQQTLDDQVFNRKQAAFILGIEVSELEQLVRERQISFLPDWSGGAIKFANYDLTTYLEEIELDLRDPQDEENESIN